MEIVLEADEAKLLREILGNHLSDLRMEIGHTEAYDLRQELKQDEATIKGLIARLDRLVVAPA